MKTNIGTLDRVIRVILAVIISILYFTEIISGTFGIILLSLGGVFLVTALIGFCPLYAPFGLSTCKTKARP